MKNIVTHYNQLKDQSLVTLQKRSSLVLELGSLTADLTRHHIDETTLKSLIDWAKEKNVPEKINALFTGEKVNTTEDLPALHTALRDNKKTRRPDIIEQQQIMKKLVEKVHQGKKITDIVHVGVGGSQLGPELVTEALEPYYQPKIKAHFLSNIDPAACHLLTRDLNPATTLVILVSKSFTTIEMLENGRRLKNWFTQNGITNNQLSEHFVIVTANEAISENTNEFNATTILRFWPWIGGRFSLWSAVGTIIPLAYGWDVFEDLLTGAHKVDHHFQTTPLLGNIPFLLAILGYWYRTTFDYRAHAIVPYSAGLKHLPDYFQQLEMESNGKNTTLEGNPVITATAPVILGLVGTDAQHAFFQWLHQGTDITPIDFIIFKNTPLKEQDGQSHLIANALAQADLLATGRSHDDPHRAYSGNRPSTLLQFNDLSPETLGMLLALYEHKVYVQSILWNINAFDQFGVEGGKEQAQKILKQQA